MKKSRFTEEQRTRCVWLMAAQRQLRRSCELSLLQRTAWYAKSRARDRSALRQRIATPL